MEIKITPNEMKKAVENYIAQKFEGLKVTKVVFTRKRNGEVEAKVEVNNG